MASAFFEGPQGQTEGPWPWPRAARAARSRRLRGRRSLLGFDIPIRVHQCTSVDLRSEHEARVRTSPKMRMATETQKFPVLCVAEPVLSDSSRGLTFRRYLLTECDP